MGEITILDQVIPIGQGAFFELDVIHPETAGGFPNPDAKVNGGGSSVRGQSERELLTFPDFLSAREVGTVEETGDSVTFVVLDP